MSKRKAPRLRDARESSWAVVTCPPHRRSSGSFHAVLSILQSAVYKKTGKVIRPVQPGDRNAEVRDGKQRIFDSLFDPALFDILVSELGEIIGTTTSLCPGENHHASLHNLYNDKMLFTLYMFLRRCFHETPNATCENYRESF